MCSNNLIESTKKKILTGNFGFINVNFSRENLVVKTYLIVVNIFKDI